jgi:hypothetical protein
MDEGLLCVRVCACSPVSRHRRLPGVWSVGFSISYPLVGTAVAMVDISAALSVPCVWLARLAAYRLTGLACPKSAANRRTESLPLRANRQVRDTNSGVRGAGVAVGHAGLRADAGLFAIDKSPYPCRL